MQRVSVKSNTTGITYFFDVTFKETHSFTNQITQNPVQTGAAVNDHVYQQPCAFTWEVGASDCLGAMGKGTSWSSSVYAFAVLESMWQTVDVLTVMTEFHQYTNMIIKSFVVNRDKNSMFAMRATVVFQEIIVTEAVAISVSQKTTSDPQATGKNNAGVKATSTSDYKQSAYITGSGGYGVNSSSTTSEADR